jgi:hypothetical protein
MSRTERNQQLSNWLNSEKRKDQVELEGEKNRLIQDLKKLKKGDLFPEPIKLTLWQKLKILILGS